MNAEARKRATLIFLVTLLIAIAILAVSVVKTNAYNSVRHQAPFSGETLFTTDTLRGKEVTVTAAARSSTWTKLFDLNNEGRTEHDFQAYTYDFTVSNNTRDEVEDFSFRLDFNQEVYLSSAWNGALEIHQHTDGGEIVDTVPDLREFDPDAHTLKTITVDGENLISMMPGDYLIYHPSTSMNAMEMPIEPYEATTPGVILYVAIGQSIDDSTLDLSYTFHRLLINEPLFWISMVCFGVWLVALLIYAITSSQIKKYNERHQRDNEIINESIETFTGFIDAKDPYTNGHSKRVALYTKRIAKEFGYEGEDLDRIYYIALLHDCGKIGVPDHILGKPGRLTDEEFEIIKSHTVRGGGDPQQLQEPEGRGRRGLLPPRAVRRPGLPRGESRGGHPLHRPDDLRGGLLRRHEHQPGLPGQALQGAHHQRDREQQGQAVRPQGGGRDAGPHPGRAGRHRRRLTAPKNADRRQRAPEIRFSGALFICEAKRYAVIFVPGSPGPASPGSPPGGPAPAPGPKPRSPRKRSPG